jgi:putative phosphoribosyl transferase
MKEQYVDRLDAGRRLARALAQYRDSDAVVIGLARGGIVVAYAVSEALHLPLQALVVRKVGAPNQPELAIGAVSEIGTSWLDHKLMGEVGATASYAEEEVGRKLVEAKERQQKYATAQAQEDLHGRTAIVVDDGIATGATALVAVQSVRDLGASKVVLATPVASHRAVHALEPRVDELVVLDTPFPFWAIGFFYQHFQQVSDDDVLHYLQLAQRRAAVAGIPSPA